MLITAGSQRVKMVVEIEGAILQLGYEYTSVKYICLHINFTNFF